MYQELLLKDIAEIKMGYLPRQKLEERSHGGARLLQMRDLSDSGTFNYESAARTDLSPKDLDRFTVRDGDVLLVNRGASLRAALISNPPQGTLVSAHFFLMRATLRDLLPSFLAWFLNQQS